MWPVEAWLVHFTMHIRLLCWKAVCNTAWCNAISELLESVATGSCGGRQYEQVLKGLEKFMVNRSIRRVGRNVPSNIFNPMITEAEEVWRERAAEGG